LELWNQDLRAELLLAESERVRTLAQREEACFNADVADREFQRMRPLRQRGLVSEEELDVAETKAKAARAVCRAAQASIKVAEAKVAVGREALERTILRAPFAGVVAEITGEVGEFVTPSPPGIPTPPAVDLLDNACLYVNAPIDEVDAPSIKLGMNTKITLDAFRDRVFPGQVRRIAPYVMDFEKQARIVDVEADFTEPEVTTLLLPGYSADIEVVLEQREGVLRVPTEAILEGSRVYLYSDGELREKTIETGLSNWTYTEVRSGLDKGDQVVTSVDREGIEDGAHATPEESENLDLVGPQSGDPQVSEKSL
jgi:HlyD family secretion protein